MRIPLDRLLLKPNVSAGISPWVLLSLAHMLRSTDGDAPPITVRPEGGHYRILDGRHRYLASVIAGRPDVLAQIEAPDPQHRQESAMTERAPEPTADTPDPNVIPDPNTAPEGQGNEPLDAGDDA